MRVQAGRFYPRYNYLDYILQLHTASKETGEKTYYSETTVDILPHSVIVSLDQPGS